MKKLTLALLLLALALVHPVAHAETSFPPRVLPDSLGVNAQFLFNGGGIGSSLSLTEEEKSTLAGAIAGQGLRVARMVVHWRFAEPNPPDPATGIHDYKWQTADSHMRILASNGVRAAPLFAGTPAWDSAIGPGDLFNNLGSDKWVPLHPEYYGAFVAAYARRYGAGGAFWTENPDLPQLPPTTFEIWNEPNLNGAFTNAAGGSCPMHLVGFDQAPKHYTMLYQAAYHALKDVNPAAIVMVGGLVGWTTPASDDRCTVQEFLAGMKAHDANVKIDAIGMHIYRPNAEETIKRLVEIRTEIDKLGWPAVIPLHVNETGYVTSGNAWQIDDATRGAHLAETADRMLRSNCGVRQFVPHTWVTSETDPANQEHWFGIANLDGTVKASAEAYGAAARTLQGQGPAAPNPATERLCGNRPDPDIDRDGTLDPQDSAPAQAAPRPPAGSFPPRVLHDSLSINAQFMFGWLGTGLPSKVNDLGKRTLARAVASEGIRHARIAIHWKFVEPNPPDPITGKHTYLWDHYDTQMRILAEQGVRAAPTLGGTPGWDTPLLNSTVAPSSESWAPLHPEYFGAFAGAFATRYGADGTFWTENPDLPRLPAETYEIWNEPNGGYFTTGTGSCPFDRHTQPLGIQNADPAPGRYAEVYEAAHGPIKQVDPSAIVMVGGLIGWTRYHTDDRCTVQVFLAGMKKHRPALEVDAIGIHIYQPTAQLVEAQLAEIRRKIDALGWPKSLPLYLNETGYGVFPSVDYDAKDVQRGVYLAQAADRILRSNCGVRQYAPHTWATADANPANGEHWLGMANRDGSVKYSGRAYGAMVRTLQGEGTQAAESSSLMICDNRPAPDIDGDGVPDADDPYPADPGRSAVFSMTIMPQTIEGPKNTDLGAELAFDLQAGASDQIELRAQGLPDDVTVQIPQQVLLEGDRTVELSVRAGPKVAPGTYAFQVVATGSAVTRTVNATLAITDDDLL